MVHGRPKRVLFLCTGNSARSQIAEALMHHIARGQFDAVSAGTNPRDAVHPDALDVLARNDVPAQGLEPKPVSKFHGQSFDYVISVCDRAKEQCPVFPGADMIHWSFPDPAVIDDLPRRWRAFEEVFQGLTRRVQLFVLVNERA